MARSVAQQMAVTELRLGGFTITNTYLDGAIRMGRELPNGDELFTFVGPDGSFRPPRVLADVIEALQREWAEENAKFSDEVPATL
jgi:hypothetical protein